MRELTTDQIRNAFARLEAMPTDEFQRLLADVVNEGEGPGPISLKAEMRLRAVMRERYGDEAVDEMDRLEREIREQSKITERGQVARER